MATYTFANDNNFFKLKKISGAFTITEFLADGLPNLEDTINSSEITPETDLYSLQMSCPLSMVAGRQTSLYANLNSVETNANFASWSLYVVSVSPDGERSVETILPNSVFNQDIIEGSNYRFWIDFTTPTLTNGNDYELVIVDTADSNQILYVSRSIKYKSTDADLQLVRFRNEVDIFNFGYAANASFYNRFYLDFYARDPQPSTRSVGYVISSGAFLPVRSNTGTVLRFITQAYDRFDHEAFNAMTLHGVWQYAYLGNWSTLKRPEDSDYAPEWVERHLLADAEINIERSSTFVNNKNT